MRAYGRITMAAVLLISLLVILLPGVAETTKELSSMPFVASLVGALWLVWRDELACEKEKMLEEFRARHTLGIASHMATVTFNKQVEFAEEYLSALQTGMRGLYGKVAGPAEAKALAEELKSIRSKHCFWIAEDLEMQLVPIECALGSIASGPLRMEMLDRGDPLRKELRQEVYDGLLVLFGKKPPTNEEEKLASEKAVIQAIRKQLGIEKLTDLRNHLLDSALKVGGS